MKKNQLCEILLLSFIYLQFALIPLGPEVTFGSVLFIFLLVVMCFGFNNLIKSTLLCLNNSFVFFQFAIVLLTLASAFYGNSFLYTFLIGLKSLVIFMLCAKTAELYAAMSVLPGTPFTFKDFTLKLLEKAAIISAFFTAYLILINFGHKDALLRGANATTSSILAFYLIVNLSQLHQCKLKNLVLFMCFLLSTGSFSGAFFLSSILLSILIFSTRYIRILNFLKLFKVAIFIVVTSTMVSIFLNFKAIIQFLLRAESAYPVFWSSGRFNYWNDLINNYQPSLIYKIFGNGFGSEQYFLENIQSISLPWLADAHNAYVSIYFGLGLLGAILFIGLITSLFIQSTSNYLSNRSSFRDVCIGSALISHFILCFGTNNFGAHFTVLTVFTLLFLDKRCLRQRA